MDQKECSKCHRIKSTQDFYRQKDKIDGLQSFCKDCDHLRVKANYLLHRDDIIQQKKVYNKTHRAQINEWSRNNKKTLTREQRIKGHLRTRVNRLLSPNKGFSVSKSVGCTPKELRAYIESQFQKGMTWSNYGISWHIDHKIPLAAFDLTIRAQAIAANHFTNLQPMLASENLQKGSSFNLQDLADFLARMSAAPLDAQKENSLQNNPLFECSPSAQ
jgi:hypothetical protein